MFEPKTIFDPGYWEEQRELERQGRGGGNGGPLGFLGLPLLIPTLLTFGAVLYPLTALATIAVWYAFHLISLALHLADIPMYALTYGPAAVVMWIGCRWDTWLGQNKVYWWGRHIVRNLLFVLLLILMASHDSSRGKTDAQILTWFFSNGETLGVSAVALVIFNVLLIGPAGVIKSFWRDGMELARLRPIGLAD
jgi:hypothetical protein